VNVTELAILQRFLDAPFGSPEMYDALDAVITMVRVKSHEEVPAWLR
jgi:hypothetical protein